MNPIDKHKEFQLGEYCYKNFVQMNEEEIRMVWSWRNDVRIRQWMTNQEKIPYENHLRFVESLKCREDRFYWLAYKNAQPVAVFDIIDVDYTNEKTEPGYYLNPELLDSGEGLFFNYNFRCFLFHVLGFEAVTGNIKVGNERAFMMSSFFEVKPYGIATFEDGEHFLMKGTREDFEKISEKGLLRAFVKASKRNAIDWEELKAHLNHE